MKKGIHEESGGVWKFSDKNTTLCTYGNHNLFSLRIIIVIIIRV